MILHTVNKSPLQHQALGSCLQFIGDKDALVLIEDGVYAGLQGIDCGLDAVTGPVYVIAADIQARGLESRVARGVRVIDYGEFVDLCATFDVVRNWS